MWKLEPWEKHLPTEFDFKTAKGRREYQQFYKKMVWLWLDRLGLSEFRISLSFPIVKDLGSSSYGHTQVEEAAYMRAEIMEEIDPACTLDLAQARRHAIHEVCHVLLGHMTNAYRETIEKILPVPTGIGEVHLVALASLEETVCERLALAFYAATYK